MGRRAIAEMRDSETKASLEEKRGRVRRERIDAELTSRSSEGWSEGLVAAVAAVAMVEGDEPSRAKQLRLVESTGLCWRTARPNCQENCSPVLPLHRAPPFLTIVFFPLFCRCALSCAVKQNE